MSSDLCYPINQMKNILKYLLCCFIFTHFGAIHAFAISEFSTTYDNQYIFSLEGAAHTIQKIELINNFSHLYPTEYNLAISSGQVESISTTVNDTKLAPNIEKTLNLTTIHLPIRNASIGKDQKTTLVITYDTPTFAEKIGETYTLTLPKTAKGNEASSFIRTVTVPLSYPELSYSTLAPQSTTNNPDNSVSYKFVGHGDESLTIHFGNQAHYKLDLTYELKNTTTTATTTEIAIPPDTAYQQIYLDKIEPQPLEIVLDSDGNWLARYPLSPLEFKEVKATLYVVVTTTPTYFDPSSSIPTGVAKYWEQDSNVKRLASQLKNPRNLYNYLLDNFNYAHNLSSSAQRLGAPKALDNPQSVICTEYTDTFVAVSRAMGIPSRAIIGYAVTSDHNLRPQSTSVDTLHAYPEYLDPSTKTWRSVDPTWGHTTGGSEYFEQIDFGHIAFVRWGNESQYPLPAGSYKTTQQKPTIIVTPLKSLEMPEIKTDPVYRIQTDSSGDYLINQGNTAIIKTELKLPNSNLYVSYVPPYGRLPLPAPSSTKLWHTQLPLLIIALITVTSVYFLIRARHSKHKKPD